MGGVNLVRIGYVQRTTIIELARPCYRRGVTAGELALLPHLSARRTFNGRQSGLAEVLGALRLRGLAAVIGTVPAASGTGGGKPSAVWAATEAGRQFARKTRTVAGESRRG